MKQRNSQQHPAGGPENSFYHPQGMLPNDEVPQAVSVASSSGAQQGTTNSIHEKETSDGSYVPSTTEHQDVERAIRQQASSSSRTPLEQDVDHKKRQNRGSYYGS